MGISWHAIGTTGTIETAGTGCRYYLAAERLAFMHSLKTCDRLPALPEIAACRSHSVASWAAVVGGAALVSPETGGVPALRLPPVEAGGDCGAEHAANSRRAARSAFFMG
jgi:hypothetical protein